MKRVLVITKGPRICADKGKHICVWNECMAFHLYCLAHFMLNVKYQIQAETEFIFANTAKPV